MKVDVVKVAVALRQVEREEEARRSRFLGSPTVRVDDRDVEPDADGRTDCSRWARNVRVAP